MTTYDMTLRENVRIVKRKEVIPPGVVVIETIPSGAEVFIEGQNTSLTTPFTKVMKSGTYTLRLKLKHYFDHSQQLMIKSEDKQRLNIRMKPNFAALSVKGLEGAAIYIDGEETDYKVPHIFKQLASGRHSVMLKKPFYETAKRWVTIRAGEDQEVEIDLEAMFGTIHIEASSGATVYIDGESVGKGSLSHRVLEGLCFLEVKQEGYYPKSWRLDIHRRETKSIDATLVPMQGVLTVSSRPYDAKVYVGDEYLG